MDNSNILINKYMIIEGKNREILRKKCAICSDMKELVQVTKKYFSEHARAFQGSGKSLCLLLQIHEEEFEKVTSFREILNKIHKLGSELEQKSLTPTLYYNIATTIAYYKKVKIDLVYLSNTKAQKAFKNFLKEDYNKYCKKYRGYDCFSKKDLPELLSSLEEDEIADLININADIFKHYNWQ